MAKLCFLDKRGSHRIKWVGAPFIRLHSDQVMWPWRVCLVSLNLSTLISKTDAKPMLWGCCEDYGNLWKTRAVVVAQQMVGTGIESVVGCGNDYHANSGPSDMNKDEESPVCVWLKLIAVIVLWRVRGFSREGNLITGILLWRGNRLNEIISGWKVLARLWERSHLFSLHLKTKTKKKNILHMCDRWCWLTGISGSCLQPIFLCSQLFIASPTTTPKIYENQLSPVDCRTWLSIECFPPSSAPYHKADKKETSPTPS